MTNREKGGPRPETVKNGEGKEGDNEEKEYEPVPRLRIFGASIEKHPDSPNEDAYLTVPEAGVAGVFDGVGGNADGDLASAFARDTLRDLVENQFNAPPETLKEAEWHMDKLVRELQRRFAEEKQQPGAMALRAKTTGAIMRVFQDKEGERHAVIGNIGDSRVHVFRNTPEGPTLETLTLDDSALRDYFDDPKRDMENALKHQNTFANLATEKAFQNAIEAGEFSDLNEKSAQFVFRSRFSNAVTQTLGGVDLVGTYEGMSSHEIEPRVVSVNLDTGDIPVLTTDGSHDNLSNPEMARVINHALENGEDPAQALVRAARERAEDTDSPEARFRRKTDDLTAVVIEQSAPYDN